MSQLIFIDQIGRTIIGEELSRDGSRLQVKNPCMINVNQMQNGQLQVQLFPLFFPEFLSETSRSKGSVFEFNLANLALGVGVEVDSRLLEQYTRICNPPPVAQTPSDEPPVIKLFDE
jgi:hypothetical protein